VAVGQRQQGALVQLGPAQLANDQAADENKRAVGHRDDLLRIG
jgi:hypothetical protein